MIISKCCSDAVYTASTRCGYAYYVCSKCNIECDTTVAFLFLDEACDTLSAGEVTTDDDTHAYV